MGELFAVGRDPACLVWGTDLLFSSICIWGEVQGQRVILCWTGLSEALVVLYIFRIPFRIRDLIKWVVTDCVLSSSYHRHAVYPGTFPSTAFSWDRGTMFLEIFERITSHEDKEFTPLWPVVSIFPQSIFIWKTCQPTYVYFSMTYAKKQMCHKTIISLWWN